MPSEPLIALALSLLISLAPFLPAAEKSAPEEEPAPAVEETPKRKPGRPKKAAAPAKVKEPVVEEAPKKKPGRSKKTAAPAESKEDAPKKTTRKRKKAE